jgi:hypothetical protein
MSKTCTLQSNFQTHFKVAIIGCGNVGATAAYSMLLEGTPTEMALIDYNKERAEGLLLDFNHALSFLPYCKITAGGDLTLRESSFLTLQYDATSSRWRAKNSNTSTLPQARRGVYHFHSMLGVTTDSAISSQVSGGSNSATATNSQAGHPGIVRHTTGTSATGRAGMLSVNPDGILLGNSWYWRFESMLRITTLSTGAQTYTYRAGFIDSAVGEPVDGVYFRYTHGVNAGQWELVCRSNDTETATSSTTAPATNTWYRMTIIVKAPTFHHQHSPLFPKTVCRFPDALF